VFHEYMSIRKALRAQQGTYKSRRSFAEVTLATSTMQTECVCSLLQDLVQSCLQSIACEQAPGRLVKDQLIRPSDLTPSRCPCQH